MRTKLGVLGLCAVVLGMMAMSTSAAQGATLSWLILDTNGANPAELLASLVGEKDSTHLVLLTKIIKLMISVTCTDFELIKVNIAGVGQVEEKGQVKFTNCAVYNGTALEKKLPCTVKTVGAASGTVVSNEGKGKLVLHTLTGGGTEVLTELAPLVGTTFATLLFEGAECSLPAENPVSGSLFLKDCLKEGATAFAERHLVEQGPLTSLTVGADTAEHLETSLIGSGWIKLGGAHATFKWKALDVA